MNTTARREKKKKKEKTKEKTTMPDATTSSAEAQASYALLQQGCHAYNPDYETSYDYVPSRAAGIVFVILFLIPMVYHIVTTCRLRGRATTSILLAIGALSKFPTRHTLIITTPPPPDTLFPCPGLSQS